MSTSRIEIPLTLPPPHFDDEATIATARQVVPLSGARRAERRRKLLLVAPFLLASTVFGALGAAAVNYFAGRNQSSAVTTQPATLPSPATPPKAEASPIPAVQQPNVEEKPEQQPAESVNSATGSTAQPTPGTKAASRAKAEDARAKSTPSPVKRDTPTEPARLVRKRRVQQPAPETSQRNRRNGASRIEDLFGGPNP